MKMIHEGLVADFTMSHILMCMYMDNQIPKQPSPPNVDHNNTHTTLAETQWPHKVEEVGDCDLKQWR